MIPSNGAASAGAAQLRSATLPAISPLSRRPSRAIVAMALFFGADIDRDAITAKKTEAQEMRCRAS